MRLSEPQLTKILAAVTWSSCAVAVHARHARVTPRKN